MDAKRGGWNITLAFGVLSLIPRLYVALAWPREPVWDGHYYDFGARRIAQGFGYSDDIVTQSASIWHPWCHYPVGYSGFLGALYALFGPGQFVAPIANAVLGAVIVILTHRIAVHWLSPRRAIAAALLCCLSLELVFYSPLVMTEILAAALPLLALWLGLVWGNSWIGLLATGATLGLATLVQPQSILMAPIVGAIVTSGRVLSWRRVLGVVVTTVAALAVVTPWTLRNCRVMDRCAFVSTNGGWNLAIGSFPRATGRFETLRSMDGCALETGQVQQDRCWATLGAKWIKEDFGRWIALAPAKLGNCFDHASFPVEYLAQADPATWPDDVRLRWRRLLTAVHRILLSVAAFGFVAKRSRESKESKESKEWRIVETAIGACMAVLVVYAWLSEVPTFWPLAVGIGLSGLVVRKSGPHLGPVGAWIAATFVVFVITHIVFFGEDRYHVRLIPLLCLLAAAVRRGSVSHPSADATLQCSRC